MGKAPLPSEVPSPPKYYLVPKFVDVIDQSVEGISFVCMRTVVVAAAGLDHHDTLGEGFSIIAAEPDLDSPGLLGSTAPAIHTRPTVLGAVLLHTGASSISKPYGGWGLLSLGTFFSFL